MLQLDLIFAAPVAATLFVITIITSIRAFSDPGLKARFLLNPYRVVHHKDWPTLLTHGLIHSGWTHLIFNMLAFYFFAFYLELILGHWQFAVFYVLSLLVATVPALARHKDHSWYNSLGASGAISAVVMALVVVMPEMGIGLLFIPGSIPGWLFAILYLGFSFVASFKNWGNVAHDAHLFGAIAGIVLVVLLRPESATEFIQWLGQKI